MKISKVAVLLTTVVLAISVELWVHQQAIPSENLKEARTNHSSVLLPNGNVLLVGGYTSRREMLWQKLYTKLTSGKYDFLEVLTPSWNTLDLSEWEIIDPIEGTTQIGSISTGPDGHHAILLRSGKVLITGADVKWGVGGLVNPSGPCSIFDPESKTNVPTGDMEADRISFSLAQLPDGRVILTGGDSRTNGAQTLIFDPVDGKWTKTGNMIEVRKYFSLITLNDGSVLAIGGCDVDWSMRKSCEVYDPKLGTWKKTGDLLQARYSQSATVLLNGKVLIAGGSASGKCGITACELYDPSTGVSSLTGSLHEARSSHTATLLRSGKVLVTGGCSTLALAPPATTCELFDPAIGTWSNTGSLICPRENATATLLPDGRVLEAGGLNQRFESEASFEIYDPKKGTWSQPNLNTNLQK